MKIEHKLNPETAAFVGNIVEQLTNGRGEYLKALGTAKEVELRCELLRQSLQAHLGLVEQAAKLPKSITPYQLSPDGTKLIGEVPDTPPAAALSAPDLSVPDNTAEVRTNGLAREADHA